MTMTRPRHLSRLLILSCLPYLVFSFLVSSPEKYAPPGGIAIASTTATTRPNHGRILGTWLQAEKDQTVVQIDTFLEEDKVTSLFAWISRAFEGDTRYGNIMLAVVAIFGNMKSDSAPVQLVQEARRYRPEEEKPVGDSFSLAEREQASFTIGCTKHDPCRRLGENLTPWVSSNHCSSLGPKFYRYRETNLA
jgi:hypothetical protein